MAIKTSKANRRRSLRRLPWAIALLWMAAAVPVAEAAIYTCVTADDRRLTSDRPIPECSGREQFIRNPDASIKAVVPPSLTAEERGQADALERRRAAERLAQQDAIRRDRSLLSRYPNEAAHQKARELALDDVRNYVRNSELRMAALAKERVPLLNEAEFYKGKALPAKLKEQLEANDAAVDAQRSLVLNQTAERDRINALFDAEIVQLRKLWAGAPPGSLGTLPANAAASRATAPRR